MGHLSGSQITVLALWSFGIVLNQACGLSKVAATLASHLQKKEGNLRQRLREWYRDQADKQGPKRLDWQVQSSFAALLNWIVKLWPSEEHFLALAMDATSLKKVFVVLTISVVYRGCAIPIAWAVLPEGKPGSWKQPWLDLFQALQGIVPADWTVIVMADRGLYARWLFTAIQACGWHPFLRINQRGTYCLPGHAEFQPLSQLVPSMGSAWSGRVTCFGNNSVVGTVLAFWGAPYKDAWIILTDLPPQQARVYWYGMRSWIENFFKDLKRDAWQWQKTRMVNPTRAARFWLALAVATLWTVTTGGHVDAHLPVCSLEALPPTHIARRSKKRAASPRLLSCFSRGLIQIHSDLMNSQSVILHRFIPEPWT